jgi:hypothetical protein
VAAAVAAAQAGASVALIERAAYLGGAATHSNVLTYCGFWTQADPAVQIVRGVGENVLREIDALGGDTAPVRTASNVVIALLDPEIVKFALDRVCERAGIDVLLHTTLIGATSAADGIAWIDTFDHGGTTEYAAAAFVDASGDADLATLCGAAVRYGGSDGAAQNGTLVVRFGGIAADADTSRAAWEGAVRAAKARGADALTKEHGLVIRIPGSNDVLAYLVDEDYDVRDVHALAAAERHGRRAAWQLLDAVRALPGHAGAYIVTTGPAIGTRESRHVVGRRPLTEAEVVGGAHFPDAVALGGWPVEHHPGAGLPNRWIRIRNEGAYEIPLGTLHSKTHPNLFAAGRTLDADMYAFASLRVMGTAFATGQAAGVAAAQTARNGAVDAAQVRTELVRQGALIVAPQPEGSS